MLPFITFPVLWDVCLCVRRLVCEMSKGNFVEFSATFPWLLGLTQVTRLVHLHPTSLLVGASRGLILFSSTLSAFLQQRQSHNSSGQNAGVWQL